MIAEKAEWPLSQNANFESVPDPSQPFDYEAVPSTFYFNAEGVGAVPVRDVVERGLDILVNSLAGIILAVQKETGGDEEDEEVDDGQGMVNPEMGGGYDAYGGGGPDWNGGGGGAWQGGGLIR